VGFNLEDYEPVQSRFARFIEWSKTTENFFAVQSEMLSAPGADVCVFKTSILCDGQIIATGHAEEVRGAGNVNRTSHVENCETSSLGRCLASFPLANFAGTDVNKRPSREEMAKVERATAAGRGYLPAQPKIVHTKSYAEYGEGVGVKVRGNQFGPLPDWLIAEAKAAGIAEVYDNRDQVAGTKRPWFKATEGGKDAKAFWPPRGTPDPIIATHEDDLAEPSPEDPF
jgi:hypothetical protein